MNKLIALVAAILILSYPTEGRAVIFDLGISFVLDSGISEMVGNLQTTQTGAFTTKVEIETFFNSSTYTVQAISGTSELYTLTNANSFWELLPGGTRPTAAVTSTDQALTIEFETPNEFSEMILILRSSALTEAFQFNQQNNISDQQFLFMHEDTSPSGQTNLPFGSPLVFSAIPEPASIFPTSIGACVLLLRRRRRIRD